MDRNITSVLVYHFSDKIILSNVMDAYRTLKIILYSFLLFIFMNNCSEKPSPPHYTNIYDPNLGFDDNPPLVHLTFRPDSGITNETEFTFDASGSKEQELPDAGLYYRWDFDNDDIWDTPESQESKINYIYKKGGGHIKVKLSVRGAKFLYADTTVNLFVNTRPYVSLNWRSDLNNENLIHFDASSSWDYEDGNELEYRWDFDNDGAWDTPWNSNPLAEHLYTKPDWTIKFEARDTDHLSAKKTLIKNLPVDYIAYYPFNGNANDESGNGSDGIVINATPTIDRFERENNAFRFYGISAYIKIPHTNILNLDANENSFSISIWLKSNYPQGNRLFEKWNGHLSEPYPISFQITSENLIGVIYDGHSVGIIPVINYGNVWDNQWHHIVFIADILQKTVAGYLDGLFLEKVDNKISSTTQNQTDILIGRSNNIDSFYNGFIDDIRIYDRALTDEEVIALYNEKP